MISTNNDTIRHKKGEEMQFLGNPIYWNPKFAQYPLSNNAYIFIAEDAHFVCTQEQFKKVNNFLSSQDLSDNFQSELDMVYIISQFKKANVLLSKPSESVYSLPVEQKSVIQLTHGHELISLSYLQHSAPLAGFAQKLSPLFSLPTSFVLVDDLLDECLLTLPQVQKKAWVLVKITGRTITLGLFHNNSKTGNCYACAHQYIKQNQSARAWAQQHSEKPILIPLNFTSEQYADRLINAFAQLIKGSDANKMLTLDTFTGLIQHHTVIPHPLCPNHGEKGKEPTPITLQSSKKVALQDGGYRTITQDEAIANLARVISPLTGIITSVNSLTKKTDGLTIYGATFSRFPKSNRGNQSFIYYALGKGVADEQSKMSALAEAIERYTVMYDGSEHKIYAKATALDAPVLLPQQLKQYSKKQLDYFKKHPAAIQAIHEFREDIPLHWKPVYSVITDKKHYIPFTACHSNTPLNDEQYVHFDSNGCASGNTLEEAILQGFLELIERDAVAIWWYNKMERPAISLEELNDEGFSKIKETLDPEWNYWLLDLSHDFNIPVVAAVGKHKENQAYRLAFGAHLDAALACKRALTELYQIIVVGNQKDTAFAFDKINDQPFLFPSTTLANRKLSDFESIANTDLKDDLLYCFHTAKTLGFDVLVADLSKASIPLNVVKVIVPNLNFIWPEFGNSRLYQLPVQLGWRTQQLQEIDLNNLSLFL